MKSVLGKYWSCYDLDENLVSKLSKELGISDFLSRLLYPRISSKQNEDFLLQAHKFLNPKIKTHFPDPFSLLDMKSGVSRVISAIENGEKICIFADYDVDGATSSALLKNVFKSLKVDSTIYVPDRIAEGYGPNKPAMQKIKDNGAKLLITVDCGSMAFEALEYASEVGLDVIVIDHHITTALMPKAVAVINPNRLDETTAHKNLAAVGVSFLFAAALISKLKDSGYFEQKNIPYPDLISHLDVVALGTVCDVMTLTGLNRAIVSQGLKVARQRSNLGYKTLCDVASLDSAIECYHLGFVLGPRINAGGRVGKADLGARLLSTNCPIEAEELARQLDSYNNERKVIELTMIEEAGRIADLQKSDPVIFVVGHGWHPGVIGIVAGRLKEKYNKPSIVVAVNEGIGKASCRSVRGIDLGAQILLAKEADLLIAGGGHYMAAGFTASLKKLDELHKFLKERCSKLFLNTEDHLHEKYDLSLSPNSLSLGLISEIEKLAPFGNGNPSPIFMLPGLFVLKANIMQNKHIRIVFAADKNSHSIKAPTVNAVCFNAVGTEIESAIMSRKPLTMNAIGTLKVNSWQGVDSLQFQLIDLVC